MSVDEYSYSFLLLPKMKTATSTEQRTESSCAFLNRPPFRFRKVLSRACARTVSYRGSSHREFSGEGTYTERLRSSLMALISIFLRPMSSVRRVDNATMWWGVKDGRGAKELPAGG